MRAMKVAGLALLVLAGCASTTSRGKAELNPGMTKEEVSKIMGKPDDRSFKDDNEAWQYNDVVAFGQCEYLTAWFMQGKLRAVTTRKAASIAGCSAGSIAVDWGQMPRNSIDVNITKKTE